MNVPDGQFDELRGLVARLRERQLTAADELRLKQILTDSAEARIAYAEYLALGALLELEVAAIFPDTKLAEPLRSLQAVSPSPLMREVSSVSPSPLMGEGRGEGSSASRLAPAPPVKSPVLGFLGGVVDYVSHSRMLMFWLMFAVLGTVFIAHFGSLMLSRFWAQRNEQIAQNGGGAGQRPGGPAERPEVPAGKIVARLTDAIDCKWKLSEGERPSPQPSPIRGEGVVQLALDTEFSAGQQLNLTAGLAELTFDSGAKVILHAPAQFVVSEALGGDLQLGRLSAKVPHSAHGFTINTPGGKVVDLGTEFGVKVNFDRTMDVIVYVGDVAVNGTPVSGGSATQSIHVHAGEAISVGPNQPAKTIDPNDVRLVREIAPLGDKTKAEAAYVEFMKSLKPVVWFRMEGKETDRVLHDEMGGPDAKLFWDGPGNPFVNGQIGRGLWLRGMPLKDGAVVSDYPKAQNGKLSVVAWAYANSRPGWATIVANWGPAGGQFHLGLHPDSRGEGVDLHLILPEKNAPWRPFSEGESHPFPLHVWQHVAFVVDGPTVRLYRQGAEVASMQHGGLRYPVTQKSLGIGMESFDSGDPTKAGNQMWWDGKLDEVAVFNSALTAEEIKKLAGAAPR